MNIDWSTWWECAKAEFVISIISVPVCVLIGLIIGFLDNKKDDNENNNKRINNE
jgi:uncharacterized protein YneF (UPF0154 family)